jgi:iron complex transport system ATP-binding protein
MTIAHPPLEAPRHRHAPISSDSPVPSVSSSARDTAPERSRNGRGTEEALGTEPDAVRRQEHAPAMAARPESALRARGLTVELGRRTVLHGIDLDVPRCSWTAIVGPNGAGKSTLLRVLAGVLRGQGTVRLAGRELTRMTSRRRAMLLGYAPQIPVLPEALTVREYVALGRTPYHGLLAGPGRGDGIIVQESLDRLDLASLASRSLRALSGGERQRVVLARVLAQRPEVLLLDEPTASLDLGHAQQVLELIDRLRREEGMTVISTLHDLVLAAQYAERLTMIADGRVAASGAPDQVLTARRLADLYGARATVNVGPDGVRVHPLRPR